MNIRLDQKGNISFLITHVKCTKTNKIDVLVGVLYVGFNPFKLG